MRRNRNTLKMELGKGKPSCDAIAKKQHQNELQRNRQKKYREKCKTAGKISANGNEKLSATKRTRAAIQLMRAYNREAQRKSRAKMISQKRAWYRKRDRERKAALRQQRKQQDSQKENAYKPFPSKKTEYNITANARKNLPQTPENSILSCRISSVRYVAHSQMPKSHPIYQQLHWNRASKEKGSERNSKSLRSHQSEKPSKISST